MSQRVRGKFLLIAVACLGLSVLFAVAAPYLLRRRLAEGSEHSAAQDVQAIDEAVKGYIAEHGNAPPALSSLKGRIVPALSCDASACDYRSYRFHYTASPGSSKQGYSISAQPLHPQGRSFYLDETGVLRYTRENRAADKQRSVPGAFYRTIELGLRWRRAEWSGVVPRKTWVLVVRHTDELPTTSSGAAGRPGLRGLRRRIDGAPGPAGLDLVSFLAPFPVLG